MKKSILKCFIVDDAVQDGINEFGRLSGYKSENNCRAKIANNKPIVKVGKSLLLLIPLFLLKIFKH